jgi:hypothetical protein
MTSVFLKKPIVADLVKKFAPFYRTRYPPKSEDLCNIRNMVDLTPPMQPRWRTTLCRLSVTVYLIHSIRGYSAYAEASNIFQFTQPVILPAAPTQTAWYYGI